MGADHVITPSLVYMWCVHMCVCARVWGGAGGWQVGTRATLRGLDSRNHLSLRQGGLCPSSAHGKPAPCLSATPLQTYLGR